jgi:hypothetical protein
VPPYTWKVHALLTVNHKDAFEEIFQFRMCLFDFLFLADGCHQTKIRIGASSLNLSLHIMTYIVEALPLKGY